MISRKTSIALSLSLSALIACFAVTVTAQVDTTFHASIYGDLINPTGDVTVIKQQPDGKIIIGGLFSEVQGYGAPGLARLNPDGTIDTTFNAPAFVNGIGRESTISAIAILPNGKILIGGDLAGANNDPRPGIRRLNADGSLDATFFVQNIGVFHAVRDIKVQADGKILISGVFAIPNSNLNLARLNADGTNDTTFNAPNAPTSGRDIEILPDGKILALGNGNAQGGGIFPILRRFNTDGSIDSSFTQTSSGSGTPEEMAIQPDGKILISGNVTSFGASGVGRILRVNADGTFDPSFNPISGASGSVNDIAVRSDGKIIIGGGFQTFDGVTVNNIARLNTNGTLDNTFVANGVMTNSSVQDIELLPDNRILVGTNNSVLYNSLLRLSADGVVDTSFVFLVTRAGTVTRVLQQPDGKILAAGNFLYANGQIRRSLARFNEDGTLDTSFVPFFNNVAPLPIINAIALQADGKILVGSSNGFVLTRLNTNGSQDGTFTTIFPTTSYVWDIQVQPDGKILVGGDMTISTVPWRFIRLNSDGSRDTGFNPPQPGSRVHKIFLQADGKFVVGGIFSTISDIAIRHLIARYNANGGLDSGFVPPMATGAVLDIDVQADGKVIRGGTGVGRLNVDGTVDPSFAPTVNAEVAAVKIQSDGKILIGGGFSQLNGAPRNGLARFNPSGTLDPSFTSYANRTVNDIQIQTDGKILLGGLFTQLNGISNVRVGRLLNVATPLRTLFDYDGDGKADISVFRASENRWYIFKSSDSTVSQTVFAVAGDIPVPADYDGDLKTDVAIYRPSNGAWWYLSSINGAYINVNWGGEAGDIPRPSDFDGDGKTDFIIFRPTNSTWYRINSSGTVSTVQFGLSGDKPVIGDFEGDGKSDVAIYRPSTGDWWYQSSVNNAQLAVRWGISTDVPAPADFDGDGRTDFAVYRPSTGVWYVINSSNGSFLIGPFGTPEDKPVPADYDGDGKAELAVFRPSTGVWYQLRTSSGFFAMQFGVSTDVPTPYAFVP